ncbi:MAG: DUF5011 domain-containing protein [Lachnospiraceae bacterium]
MKHRGLTIALAGGCVVLGVIAAFLTVSQDTTPPEIKIEERDITYTEGDSYEGLLEGVSASDKADGDLTSEVFVNKIVLTDEHAAVVYYGVMDESNNVGMARRRVNYKTAEEAANEPADDSAADAAGEAGEGTADGAVPAGGEPTPLEANGPRPVMALTTEQLTVSVKGEFDPLSVVQGAVDDKDSMEMLYQNIHVDGEYNLNTPGVYELRYYVTDSDGNASDPHILTLTVE